MSTTQGRHVTKLQYIIALLILSSFSGCSEHQPPPGTEQPSFDRNEVTPFETVEDAIAFVKAYDGKAEDLQLPISDSLIDDVGANMAIITDQVLAKDFWPDGFEQRDGYRLYSYKPAE